jgi:hypothetical protein
MYRMYAEKPIYVTLFTFHLDAPIRHLDHGTVAEVKNLPNRPVISVLNSQARVITVNLELCNHNYSLARKFQ